MEELTAQDIADIEQLTAEPDAADEKHTLLEIWTSVLKNIEGSAALKITPSVANRIVTTWPKLSVQDAAVYHTLYHAKLLEMRELLAAEIATDPDCFKNIGDGDDAQFNRHHYLEMLFAWQALTGKWEHDWDATSPTAHIELAANADVGAFFLGNTGLVDHLGQIEFDFDEDARDEMAARLIAALEGL